MNRNSNTDEIIVYNNGYLFKCFELEINNAKIKKYVNATLWYDLMCLSKNLTIILYIYNINLKLFISTVRVYFSFSFNVPCIPTMEPLIYVDVMSRLVAG